MSAPAARARLRAPITVSPAPVTSYTSRATVGMCTTAFPASNSDIPCSPRVMSTARVFNRRKSTRPTRMRSASLRTGRRVAAAAS